MVKPSHAEEEYFAREEAEKLHKIHEERRKNETEQTRAARKKAHYMKCPKCGWDLATIALRSVYIDKCFECGVVVLDKGELEILAGKESEGSFLKTVVELFRS
jgi:hypothetical protein